MIALEEAIAEVEDRVKDFTGDGSGLTGKWVDYR